MVGSGFVQQAEFIFLLKGIPLEKSQIAYPRRVVPDLVELQIAYASRTNARSLLDRCKKLVSFKGDTDAARPTGKYTPMMICLGTLGKAEGQDRGEFPLIFIAPEEVGIISVVPGLRIEERYASRFQTVGDGRKVRIATQKFLKNCPFSDMISVLCRIRNSVIADLARRCASVSSGYSEKGNVFLG